MLFHIYILQIKLWRPEGPPQLVNYIWCGVECVLFCCHHVMLCNHQPSSNYCCHVSCEGHFLILTNCTLRLAVQRTALEGLEGLSTADPDARSTSLWRRLELYNHLRPDIIHFKITIIQIPTGTFKLHPPMDP